MKQMTVSVPRKMLSSVLLLLAFVSISQCCLLTPIARPRPAEVHQVSVRYYGHHLCTGSLINPSYVLTVATCILYYSNVWLNIDDIEVVMYHPSLGILFTSSIKRVIVHENASTSLNDIALIVLSMPQFSSVSRPFGYAKIPLRDQGENAYVNDLIKATGFVRTHPNSEDNKTVKYRETSVFVLTKQNCIEKFNFLVPYICVDDPCPPADCRIEPVLQRNLGGALIRRSGQVVGLLSRQRVDHCSHHDYDDLPAGFIPISSYSDWIVNKMFNVTNLEKGMCTFGCVPFIRNLYD